MVPASARVSSCHQARLGLVGLARGGRFELTTAAPRFLARLPLPRLSRGVPPPHIACYAHPAR